MDWKLLVNRTVKSGISEDEIADYLKSRELKTSKSAIVRLRTGVTPEPRYSVGIALLSLFKKRRAVAKAQGIDI